MENVERFIGHTIKGVSGKGTADHPYIDDGGEFRKLWGKVASDDRARSDILNGKTIYVQSQYNWVHFGIFVTESENAERNVDLKITLASSTIQGLSQVNSYIEGIRQIEKRAKEAQEFFTVSFFGKVDK